MAGWVENAVQLAICRIVEETSGRGTLKYFGPGCLVKFESTKFLNSIAAPMSKYFLVASNQVLPKFLLKTLQKKHEPSVTMVAEFQDMKVGGKLERRPLNELFNSLEDDVFEYAGITYVALTQPKAGLFKKSSLLSRALEGKSSSMTSDQLQCIVLCNERTINREDRDLDELSTKVYDLLQFDSILERHESRFASYFLKNDEQKRFVGENEFQDFDGEPLGSIILNRDAKFVGVLNFIENQPAPAFAVRGFETAASERHDDVSEVEMHAGASGGIYPLLNPQSKSEVGTETEICKVAEPAVTSLTRGVLDEEGELQEKRDFANGRQLPTENSYRSSHCNSSTYKAEVFEQHLTGEMHVVGLFPENGSKEMPAPAEPEQRGHTNNNGEPSLQDSEEQLRDQYNDLRVQANNNEKASMQDQAEPLRDQDDDFGVHRRNNNDEPLAEAPGGETDDVERADPNDVLLQDRSGDDSHQGQDGAASGIAHDQRGEEQRDLSDLQDMSYVLTTFQASQKPGQRSLLSYAPGESELEEDLVRSVSGQTSEVNSDRVSEQRGRLPGTGRRIWQRSSGESTAPQSASDQSENRDVSDTEALHQQRLRGSQSPRQRSLPSYAPGERDFEDDLASSVHWQTSELNSDREQCVRLPRTDVSETRTLQHQGFRESPPDDTTTLSDLQKQVRNNIKESNANTDQRQNANEARARNGSASNTRTENKGASNCSVTMDGCSGPVVIGRHTVLNIRSTPEYEQRDRLPRRRRRTRQRSSGEPVAPHSASNQSEDRDVSETETLPQQGHRESNANTDQRQNANEARARNGSASNTRTENASNVSLDMKRCSGPVVLGDYTSLTIESTSEYDQQ